MIAVSPDPAQDGQAVIRIDGAAGKPAALRIQRDADYADATLGPDGWQSSDVMLDPLHAESDGADLLLTLGWPVCRYLEAGVYRVTLPAASPEPEAVFWPDITPPHAPPVIPGPAPPPAPATTVVTPKPMPAAPAMPPAPPPPKPAGRFPWIALVLLVLVAAGSGGWWYWQRRETPPATSSAVPAPVPDSSTPPPVADTAVPTETPPTSAANAPPDLTTMSVPDVLAKAPNPAAIVTEARRRLGTAQKDDGLLLLEAASDRGDGAAAAAIARLYDPVGFQPGGPIPSPDPRQAARYYRDAETHGQDITAAREALRASLETKKQQGDFAAGLILKDFWP